ncbi:Ubiquitin-conjugating_enzyme E2 [Hexamita inflata]|uniref:Ubiquitin-conjugating enzyme E2 n=1 Tax=Hexamita inflata TaxID=28002 RepID=A0AA86R6S8_9EUKA|nr:Ubiquitin-conjugating enzyme E2 [Hexamita inflata]
MNPQTIRRIKTELQSHVKNPQSFFRTYADPNNIANVHFTFLGPPDSPYEGGLYHGIILLSDQYPMKPPNIQFLNDNGRFEPRKNICTTFTAYHEESWLPTWNISNIVLGLRSMFSEDTPGSIGSIQCSADQRKNFASKSKDFKCKICGSDHSALKLDDNQTVEKTAEKTTPTEKAVEKLPEKTLETTTTTEKETEKTVEKETEPLQENQEKKINEVEKEEKTNQIIQPIEPVEQNKQEEPKMEEEKTTPPLQNEESEEEEEVPQNADYVFALVNCKIQQLKRWK